MEWPAIVILIVSGIFGLFLLGIGIGITVELVISIFCGSSEKRRDQRVYREYTEWQQKRKE